MVAFSRFPSNRTNTTARTSTLFVALLLLASRCKRTYHDNLVLSIRVHLHPLSARLRVDQDQTEQDRIQHDDLGIVRQTQSYQGERQ